MGPTHHIFSFLFISPRPPTVPRSHHRPSPPPPPSLSLSASATAPLLPAPLLPAALLTGAAPPDAPLHGGRAAPPRGQASSMPPRPWAGELGGGRRPSSSGRRSKQGPLAGRISAAAPCPALPPSSFLSPLSGSSAVAASGPPLGSAPVCPPPLPRRRARALARAPTGMAELQPPTWLPPSLLRPRRRPPSLSPSGQAGSGLRGSAEARRGPGGRRRGEGGVECADPAPSSHVRCPVASLPR